MQYFTNDFTQFFIELSQNNNKEWFHSQKKRYESSVKNPFHNFLNAYIQAIQQYDPTLTIEPKDCVLRINRDIRFAKDKTPYNTHYTAFVSNGGKKNKNIPGIFLRFSPESVGIMGGCYMPDKIQLAAIRETIAEDISDFRKVIEAPDFIGKFGSIKGEAHKRVPKEYKIIVGDEPLILNKQFYFVAEEEPDILISKHLLEKMMTYWHAARPVNQYFYKIIG